ncbi:hypothetical protein SDC9_53887 [bioreactor metagenome]|uniref:Uncharacterized protein n=1 Tax=bioreactor metagenome TaxID=1076179 RepID=A0A644WVF7_9ZZZZ
MPLLFITFIDGFNEAVTSSFVISGPAGKYVIAEDEVTAVISGAKFSSI